MFNGIMDPELFKLAQEQLSRMSPAEFTKIQQQMMSNPDLMRMASESMQNMRPEDLKHAAEQLKHTHPVEMAEIGEKMANASPQDIAALRARVDAQMNYEISAAQMMKDQGNVLHGQGRFHDALQKYLLAKKSLVDIPSSKGRTLLLACSLNLMSCYLKTKQYDECIDEGSEVLAYDARNVKALYRRGQAYTALGQLDDAVSDLSKAHEASPQDETIADVLKDAKERLSNDSGPSAPRRLVVEEIAEEVGTASSGNQQKSSEKYSVTQQRGSTDVSSSGNRPSWIDLTSKLECSQALKDDPETQRMFQNFISNVDPSTLATLSDGKVGDVSPSMFEAASNMISKMSPEELQRMFQMASSLEGGSSNSNSFGPGLAPPNVSPDILKTASDMMSNMSEEERQRMFQMASSLQGKNPYTSGGSLNSDKISPWSVHPNMTPDLVKTATDMMSKMSAEEHQKMFEMASSMSKKDSVPTALASNTHGLSLGTQLTLSESRESTTLNRDNIVDETPPSFVSNIMSAPLSNIPNSTADLQEQMRNQMKDPAMQQMFTSVIQNMSPSVMANMNEQLGLKLSPEDLAKAQQAMSSFSPKDLDRMMRWADRIHTGVEGMKKTKNWLLGKPGMISAICILILAITLHRMGYIGS